MSGGLVAAVVSLPQSVPLGAIAFAPLGPDWIWLGVLSGLYCSIFAGSVAALTGGTPLMVTGPRPSASLIVAGLVAALMGQPEVIARGGAPLVATLAFAAIALSGLVQVLFGLFHVGRLIKFIPYPVIAGFMNGVAVLVLVGQMRAFLGLPEDFRWTQWRAIPELMHPGAIAVGIASLAAMVLVPRFMRRFPGPLAALLAGAAMAIVLGTLGVGVGSIIGSIPPFVFSPRPLLEMLSLPMGGWLLELLPLMAPAVLVLAVVNSVDTLLSAAALDSLTGGRHRSDRELVGQGLANLVGGCFGGVACTGSLSRSATAIKAGARTRLASFSHAIILLLTVVVASSLLTPIPMAALAGILVVVALTAFDGWSRQLMWRLPRQADHRREIVANLGVVLVVAAVTMVVNLVAAVAAGTALSMVMFVRKMCKPIVRRVLDGRARRSLKVRNRDEAESLSAKCTQILVVELDGALFFGTADSLAQEVEARLAGVRVVVLDCRRLSEMDATGVRLLGQLGKSLQAKGCALVLAHLSPEDAMGGFLLDMGGPSLDGVVRLFPDADAALEWAEDRVLELGRLGAGEPGEIALADLPLSGNLGAAELTALAGALERRQLPKGTVLFREGEAGDTLYLLAKGHVTIRLQRPDAPAVRLASFQPGVMFGEMALLEGQPRSADAVADDDIVVYELAADRFASLSEEAPRLTHHLVLNIARELAARLRVTSEQLRVAF
ncbi:MAG: SLC26A/SulP transporter family protein [Rhodospirillaceae bacterium]|nr:SLC26A/SulP transporter family protein [Rhodospirillales bacterium]